MTEKRFTTNGYYVFDHKTGYQWLVNEVEIEEIVILMNNVNTIAKERSKALSTLQKKYNTLHEENRLLKGRIQEYEEIKSN